MWPKLTSGEVWLAPGSFEPRLARSGRGTPATGLASLVVMTAWGLGEFGVVTVVDGVDEAGGGVGSASVEGGGG